MTRSRRSIRALLAAATAAELAGVNPPAGIDSISFVPVLFGRPAQPRHDWLYWVFGQTGFNQAALWDGRWKAHPKFFEGA